MSEQKTFKYLDQANSQGGDAAQDFLNRKLSGNKYMSVSNPDNPYSMGEGQAPSGAAYDKQPSADSQPKADKPADASISNEKGSLADLGFDESRIDELRTHAQSASGSGAFGYTSDTEQHFKETEDGTSAGSIQADMRKIGESLGYEHWGTANPERIKNYIMEQEKAPEALAPVVEDKPTPIKHSPEIKQAKERVQSYEQDILSGKTSEDIYKTGSNDPDNFTFNATKGAAGIGTPMNGDSKEQAEKATDSFLGNKKAEVKDKYQFIAQS